VIDPAGEKCDGKTNLKKPQQKKKMKVDAKTVPVHCKAFLKRS
jgi:hypothetical protein